MLVAESFVDSQLFRGTCYKAQGWTLLGETQGSGRSRQDYYTEHGRPKQLGQRDLAAFASKLTLFQLRTLGIYLHWRKHRKNQRQSTVKDFHDAMNRFNHRLAFATITANFTNSRSRSRS